MENGGVEKQQGQGQGQDQDQDQGVSYTYWVREAAADAAPLPLPKKLSPQDMLSNQSNPATLGSVWNRAGTWEEKNLNNWASHRIKAFLVTVRNKKRVGYTYELKLKIKGEWLLREERKTVKGHIDIPEFSFGELDDLQMEVRLSEEKDFLQQDKLQIIQDLKLFLSPIREKLLQFEQELKDR